MQFTKTSLLAICLPAITAAAALRNVDRDATVITRQATSGPQQFYLIATRSTTPIHLRQLEARDHQLWIGGDTATSCPATAECSSYKNLTGFVGTYGSPVVLNMDFAVEDGQIVYVEDDGSVRYTEAGIDCDPGSESSKIWTLNAPGSDSSNSFGNVAVANTNKTLLACPATAAAKAVGPWAVYVGPEGAQVPSGNTNDCYAFSTLASTLSSVPAYEYD